MDLEKLYQDYNILYQTEGHKHCRPGWANTPCPFCTGNAGLHLGGTLNGDRFFCWRCGYHHPKKVLSKLLGVKESEVPGIVAQYGGALRKKTEEKKIKIRRLSHRFPEPVDNLHLSHMKYLESRGFAPDKLIKEYNLMGTGPFSMLDGINYKHRILAPIYWDDKQVSFQGRDITNKHPLKYMACPMDRELIHHKQILYGRQELWKDTGIIVEGITDVWRLGELSAATFGIKYTAKQLRVISKTWKKVVVIFDDEKQAQKQAEILCSELRFRGIQAYNEKIQGDPGGLSQEDANYLVKNVLKNLFAF